MRVGLNSRHNLVEFLKLLLHCDLQTDDQHLHSFQQLDYSSLLALKERL